MGIVSIACAPPFLEVVMKSSPSPPAALLLSAMLSKYQSAAWLQALFCQF
jgi:hypothetical protein